MQVFQDPCKPIWTEFEFNVLLYVQIIIKLLYYLLPFVYNIGLKNT